MQFYGRTVGAIARGTTVSDLSGMGNHGVMTADAQFIRSPDSCSNTVGLYISAGGITIPKTPSLRLSQPITLEVWARALKLDYGYVTFMENSFGFPKYQEGDVRFYTQRNGVNFRAFERSDLDLHYYVLLVTGNGHRVYVDGRLAYNGNIIPSFIAVYYYEI